MTTIIPVTANIIERSSLLADYQRWRINLPTHLSLAPGLGLSFIDDQSVETRAFVMEADELTATVLTQGPDLSIASQTTHVRISGVFGTAWPSPGIDRPSLIVVEETGLACAIFQTFRLRQHRQLHPAPLVVAQWRAAPMKLQPSRIVVPHLPNATIAAVPLFEDWNVPSRIADPTGRPGCFDGSAVTLIRHYLENIDWKYRATLSVFVAGSASFVAEIAAETNQHGVTVHASSGA